MLAFAAAALSAPAFAQTAPAPAPAAPAVSSVSDQAPSPLVTAAAANTDDSSKEIVVTGSHLGKSSFNSPTPVNVVGEQRMKDLGIPNVADALNQIPSFRAATTPSTSLFRVSGAIGGNSVDLRGLGSTRTLTLVDGRRFVPSTDNGTVDLNGIPSALVARTEIVTGGASAAYGADAVAGVVNLILDTKFKGLKTDFSGGISEHGDNKNVSASLAYGADFAGGRGHFIFGTEYQKNWGVGVCETRDYCRGYTNYVANPGYIGGVSTNGLPATLVLRNVLFAENQTGFLVSAVQTVGTGPTAVKTTLGQQVNNTGASALPAALRGLQFNTAGTGLTAFQVGNFLSGQFMQGGDASVDRLYGFDPVPLVTPTWHSSTMAHADYDLTDTIQITGEFLYSHTNGGPISSAYYQGTPVSLDINNAYITPAVRAQILAANPNITAINVNVAKPEVGNQLIGTSDNDVYRGVLAAKGKLFGSWKWDVSYTHGETHSYVSVTNSRLNSLTQAIDAVTVTPANVSTSGLPIGSIVCRSTLSNPADGCIPVNLLGQNSITQAAYNKYWQTEWQTRTIKQDDIAANLRGNLIKLPAGMMQGAIGIEYRNDSAQGDTDAGTLAGLFTSPQTTALPLIDRKVVEGYIEASAPILADMPFAKSLTVDGSLRRTHYNSFGSATTWKVGGEYQPDDQIMIRVTRSHDIRQPTAAESNPNSIVTLLPQVDPFTNTTQTIRNISGGNANLQLEKADTFTIGTVLRPHFIPRFRVSVDYYRIDVKNAIDSLSGPVIMDACFRLNQYCNLIQFTGAYKNSAPFSLLTNFQNLAQVQARGLEIVSEYRVPNVFKGNLDFQVNANYVFRLISIGGTGVITRLDGVTGNAGSLSNVQGVPTYKIDGIITYSQPRWSVTGHARYIPNSILDPTKCGPDEACYYNPGTTNLSAASISNNRIAARFYFDLSATIRTGMHLTSGNSIEFYGSITNLFDTYPPSALRFFGNPLQYDPVGRSFRLGVRTKW